MFSNYLNTLMLCKAGKIYTKYLKIRLIKPRHIGSYELRFIFWLQISRTFLRRS